MRGDISPLQKLMWQYWLNSGSASGTELSSTGSSPITISNAVNGNIISMVRSGSCTQASTPSPSSPVGIHCNNGEIKWDSVNQRFYADGTQETVTVSSTKAQDQTATVEYLFGVGNYKDTHDIISGNITRKCRARILDGTEQWTFNSQYGYFWCNDNRDWPIERNISPFCTHFAGSIQGGAGLQNNGICVRADTAIEIDIACDQFADAAALEGFLASQYSAGTPVIVVYPLKTQVAESVSAQPLTMTKGTNTITSSYTGAEIEIHYTGVDS